MTTRSMEHPCLRVWRPTRPAQVVQCTVTQLRWLGHVQFCNPREIQKQSIEFIRDHIVQLKTMMLRTRVIGQKNCIELTREFFKADALRELLTCFPTLSHETRTHSIQLVSKVIQQQSYSRPFIPDGPICYEYLKSNIGLFDALIATAYSKTEDAELAQDYGGFLRECLRQEIVAKHVLDSPETMKRFFDYINHPDRYIKGDAWHTFRHLLLIRHPSAAATFMWENYEWFFEEYYHVRLLGSALKVLKYEGLEFLVEILAADSNSAVLRRYVGSTENLKLIMKILEDADKRNRVSAFRILKLFVVAQEKPSCIVESLRANKAEIMRLLGGVEIQNIRDFREQFWLQLNMQEVLCELDNLG